MVKNDVCKNIAAPTLDVYHADLVRMSDTSIYKSVCPVCHEGFLLVGRDPKTFELLELDACVLCSQHVRYLDVEKMRAREH